MVDNQDIYYCIYDFDLNCVNFICYLSFILFMYSPNFFLSSTITTNLFKVWKIYISV